MSRALCQPDVGLVGGLRREQVARDLGRLAAQHLRREVGAALGKICCQAAEGHLLGQAADQPVIN